MLILKKQTEYFMDGGYKEWGRVIVLGNILQISE